MARIEKEFFQKLKLPPPARMGIAPYKSPQNKREESGGWGFESLRTHMTIIISRL